MLNHFQILRHCAQIFLLIFLIVDKTDEFQLVSFILEFKDWLVMFRFGESVSPEDCFGSAGDGFSRASSTSHRALCAA